jgi:hypothetical protein
MKTPTMLFKSPGQHDWEGISHDWMICDVSDTAKYLADGWKNTIFDARDSVKASIAAPTREEMEVQAVALRIKVDGRWSDKRLLDEIAKAGQ